MNKLSIIIKDVYKKNVKSAAFVIMILAPFLVMGIFYLSQHFFGDANEINKIGIVSDQPAVAKQLAETKNKDYTFKAVASDKTAQKQLADKKIDAYLKLQSSEDKISGKLYSRASLGTSTEMALQQILSSMQTTLRASHLNLTTAQVQNVMEPAEFKATKVSFENGKMTSAEGDSGTQFVFSFLTTIVMFVFIMSYSSIIAQEIASEKGTRIMEVLLSSMKAKTHYYGKLLGVLLVALTQLLIYGAALVVGYRQFKDLPMVSDLLATVSLKTLFGSNVLIIAGFMLVGIFLYAVLSALCGSLVSKPEDTAKAIQPVMYLSMIGYMLGLILGTSDPTNMIIKVTSYIPFLSSYSMPIRLASGTTTIASAFISLGILVLFTGVLTIFSAQLYKSNVLVYSEGGTLSALKQSIAIMRNNRKKQIS
ncbi:ABC transporter permease [Enterococcus dongliensis]|uniref:ABC transporter permease n=1 Tax=Enterococcus dongliensis TaxID=2559925 RepID=A0AAW8TLD3_9ENTE|nr:ABC transporter permease [Enterococcus dongliensis]MDT2596011.1 ABC transporter permease [Enterococcus dongliensis]MDT2603453.1 ABC transporter permease [Enterococcus dongliensis]MDT2634348.1 ABC transporter permease [Enterococcus dongliensis]MDT2636865.1 ABC transporter permease [Enterococcus dongliensis]MDT2642041.1 ABC transporter permease [Enterococcus dongliensis]